MGNTLLLLSIFFIIAGIRGLYSSLNGKYIERVERFKFVKSRSFRIITIIVNSILIIFSILLFIGTIIYR